MHEENQFRDETNVLHQGGYVAVLEEDGGCPGSNVVWNRLRLGLEGNVASDWM